MIRPGPVTAPRVSVVSPTPDGLAAAMAYYDDLYNTRSPCPTAFRQLIDAHGLPDWPNPYPSGMPDHYRFHPDGFLLADLACILEGLVHDRLRSLRLSVSSHDVLAATSPTDFHANCLAQARHCWAIALTAGAPMAHLLGHAHPDNVWLASLDVWAEAALGRWPDVDASELSQGLRHLNR